MVRGYDYSGGDLNCQIMKDVANTVSTDITNDFMRNPDHVLGLLNRISRGDDPLALSDFPSASGLLDDRSLGHGGGGRGWDQSHAIDRSSYYNDSYYPVSQSNHHGPFDFLSDILPFGHGGGGGGGGSSFFDRLDPFNLFSRMDPIRDLDPRNLSQIGIPGMNYSLLPGLPSITQSVSDSYHNQKEESGGGFMGTLKSIGSAVGAALPFLGFL